MSNSCALVGSFIAEAVTKQQFARVHSIDARSNVIVTLNNRDDYMSKRRIEPPQAFVEKIL